MAFSTSCNVQTPVAANGGTVTLHLYFARRFLMTFLATLAVFTAMYFLLEMVEQFRTFEKSDAGFLAICGLTLLSLPSGLYKILPLIAVISTLVLFLGLARSSELVVTRGSGRSGLIALASPLVVAILIGVIAVAALNPIVAATSKRYETTKNRYLRGEDSTLSISAEGLWLRQGGDDGQMVIHADRASLDGTELFGVTFLGFRSDGTPLSRVQSASAKLTPGAWELTDAKKWSFAADQENPELGAVRSANLRLTSDLTIDRIKDSFGTPSSIPVWDLPRFINQLERAGFSARTHRVWLHMELSLPLILMAMVMIGAGFTMRHTRLGGTGPMVLMAIGMAFGIYFIRNLAQVLGESGQIPVLLAAWSPPIAAILMALGLILHMEDG
jgi:lipopolysaccharide export system permease protein